MTNDAPLDQGVNTPPGPEFSAESDQGHVVRWATLEFGNITKRIDRADAEKWAAMGRDRGRRVVAVMPAEDYDALTNPPAGSEG